jgi:glycosyltransferase involved in cell wall biosynthesis
MAAGKPVILAIEGVIRLEIEQAGGGIPVQPGDPQALAQAIGQLADDPALASAMGQKARTYVEAHFDRVILAARLMEIMQQMVK